MTWNTYWIAGTGFNFCIMNMDQCLWLGFSIFLICAVMGKAQRAARGPSHWINNGKITFFSSRQTEWAQAKQNGCLQVFAADMAFAYEIRYGHLKSLNDDLPNHVTPTMPSDTEIAAYAKRKAAELASLTPAEQTARQEKDKRFRDVRFTCYSFHVYSFTLSLP